MAPACPFRSRQSGTGLAAVWTRFSVSGLLVPPLAQCLFSLCFPHSVLSSTNIALALFLSVYKVIVGWLDCRRHVGRNPTLMLLLLLCLGLRDNARPAAITRQKDQKKDRESKEAPKLGASSTDAEKKKADQSASCDCAVQCCTTAQARQGVGAVENQKKIRERLYTYSSRQCRTQDIAFKMREIECTGARRGPNNVNPRKHERVLSAQIMNGKSADMKRGWETEPGKPVKNTRQKADVHPARGPSRNPGYPARENSKIVSLEYNIE